MKKTVWKFELSMAAVQAIMLPALAEALTVQMQNGAPCLWALVDPDAPKVLRTVRLVGTGHREVESDVTYLGTVQRDWFVGHFFIAPERPA